jgi:hypothetical protein
VFPLFGPTKIVLQPIDASWITHRVTMKERNAGTELVTGRFGGRSE